MADYTLSGQAFRRHRPLSTAPSARVELVRYATLAASSHNTQPWKFRLESHAISIYPDLSRRCPEVDPDDHHLYASLGCAVENLCLSAEAAGFAPHVTYGDGEPCLRVDLEPSSPRRSARFQAIPDRQCSRSEYSGEVLPADQMRALERAAAGGSTSLLLLSDDRQKREIAEYVAAGNQAQFADARWSAEMQKWIRFNPREALRTGDGLYGPSFGNPVVPGWLGRRIVRFTANAGSQNRKDRKQIASSSVIAVLYSDASDPQHWIEAGRSYERLALEATALGLCTAFINQPVEVPALRSELAAYLGLGKLRPDLVVRIGRGPRMPQSPRRPIEQIIMGAVDEDQAG
jgi:hypothetical protein